GLLPGYAVPFEITATVFFIRRNIVVASPFEGLDERCCGPRRRSAYIGDARALRCKRMALLLQHMGEDVDQGPGQAGLRIAHVGYIGKAGKTAEIALEVDRQTP